MGSKKSSSPAPVSAQQTAEDQLRAQIATLPGAAQTYYNIESNPDYGAKARTQLYESIRQELYPEETNVRNQLVQNVLSSLTSPTGITPEQQAAITARRQDAQNELIKAIRERANLGGKLYGGQSMTREAKAVADLQNQFAEQDINREYTARLNAIQSAMPLLQLLYPDMQLMNPQFINPVASGDTVYSGAVSQANTNAQLQAQQQANQNALYSALFSALGKAAGGLAGGIV